MTDKTDLIREILEYVTTHGGENTATHLLVQAASAIQTQAAELEAVGAGGVQALSAGPAIKPLEWSSENEPTDKIRYNHITAETALGQFSVEWKGCKEDDVPCIYLAGDYIGVASDVDGAKQLAEQHIRDTVASLLAASPTPQALSAAPAVDITTAGEMQAFEAWYKQDCVIEGAAAKMAAKAAWEARAMLEASPTPPAEQQARYSRLHDADALHGKQLSVYGTATTTEAALGGVYAELPRAGAIGYASVVDVDSYVTRMTIGPRLPGVRDIALWTTDQLRDFADRTHALRMQAAPKAAPGDTLDEVMRERDEAEDFINELLDEVLGADRPEWSSAYNRYDAMSDVRERITALHKPTVDKAWDQLQSAMAAPQQEAQRPWGYAWRQSPFGWGFCSKQAYEQAAGRGEEVAKLYLAPQPAPAPLSDDAKDVVRDAAFEAVRKKLCALPRFSFLSDGYGVRRVPDKSGSWIAFDAAHELFDPVAVDAALAAQGGK